MTFMCTADQRGVPGEPETTNQFYPAPPPRVWIGAPVRLPFRAVFDTNKARARVELGEDAFAKLWAEGQAMSPKEAIAYAFSVMRSRD